MPSDHTAISRLLRTYHGRIELNPNQFIGPSYTQIGHLCDVGFGPIAFATYGEAIRETDPDSYSKLQSADLTTRTIYRQMEDATLKLLARSRCQCLRDIAERNLYIARILFAASFTAEGRH